MANRLAQKITGNISPQGNSATNIRDPATSGLDKSSSGKSKRDLYLVPDHELPESRGDLSDQVETIKEVEHEHQLKQPGNPMPGMTTAHPELKTNKRKASPPTHEKYGGDPTHLQTLNQVQSTSPLLGSKTISGGGATSGTSAGFGSTDRGKSTAASAANMTGEGTSQGISNRGSAGSIAIHQPGRSGSQVKPESRERLAKQRTRRNLRLSKKSNR